MNLAFLQLGSNLGDRLGDLGLARDLIRRNIGKINNESPVYESEAWGLKEQPSYLNSIIAVSTPLSPAELLEQIFKIEELLKRSRVMKWGTRTIDIDILFYNDEIVMQSDLTIPHPLMQQRRFILIPMNEMAPEFVHPVLGKTMKELLYACEDQGKVWKYNE